MNFKTYKEGFENEEKNTGHNINEKEETINDIYMLLIGYIIIICFGVWFHKKFYEIIPDNIFILSIIALIGLPLFLYSYYIFYEIHLVREGVSYKTLLEEAKLEIEKEEKISGVIPVILFGIGIVYSNIQHISKKPILKIVAPYLIFSLLFGTVIPNIISYLVFDHYDLHRVLFASDLDFVVVSISFGLMITSLLMPFFVMY